MFNNYNSIYPGNIDWIYVQDVDSVANVSVQPNGKAWIMVQNEPVFALKVADQIGRASTEYYKFEKYNPTKNEYVTMDDLRKILEEMRNEPTSKRTKSASATATQQDE